MIRCRRMERKTLGYTVFDDKKISRKEAKIIALGGPVLELLYAGLLLVCVSVAAGFAGTLAWGVPLIAIFVFVKSATAEGADTDRSRFHGET